MRLELADLPTSRVASVGPVVWTRDAESGVAELSNLTPNAEDVGRFDVELYVEDMGFTYVGAVDESILANDTDAGDTYAFADDFDGDGLDESR